ncbi:multicopper oxidase domain-containing protein [Deinococcus peraridilitoris]|nr:multicopper oxidase domain-containing protein [Deinococcus peraridilitoris]
MGTVPIRHFTGQLREFTVEVHRIHAEIAPGVRVEQWAFGFPGEPPSVPGPEIRVKQGDLVRLTLHNTFDQPHTIHPHGIISVAQRMDGLDEVLPGQRFTYEFVATEAGTFAYHCHFQTNLHLDMGMYGALIVEPRDASAKVWTSEHTLILDEWDSRQNPTNLMHKPQANYFLVNGKAAPLIPDLHIPPKDVSLLRMINMGYAVHSMHLHGVTFLVVAKDGHDLPQPYEADTLLIGPGERYDLLVQGRDGKFVFHDHAGPHATNDGLYPGGIHFMVNGGPPLDQHGRPDEQAAHQAHAQDAVPDVSGLPLLTDADSPMVRAAGFSFSPSSLRVKLGTAVGWRNADFVAHGVVLRAPDGTEVTRSLPRGGSVQFTFDQKGTYRYRCRPHPFMTGIIVVEER